MKIDKDSLEAILFKGERDANYNTKVELSQEIQLHANGDLSLIRGLLSKKFPSEPQYVMDYRLNNISRVTKTYFNKIVATLSKIQRADDFVLNGKDKNLLRFINENIDTYDSTINWFFSVGLKNMLTEPNGVILIMPVFDVIDTPSGVDSKLEGIDLVTYTADKVLVVTKDYVILEDIKDTNYTYVDNESIINIVINTSKGSKEYEVYLKASFAPLEEIPIVVFGGNQYRPGIENVYESFASGVVPYWNQALVEFSDMQCGIKQHLFPEKWRYETSKCANCNGSGKNIISTTSGDERVDCWKCKGTGDPPTGNFSEILIHAADSLTGGEKIPTPPAGYVQKDFSALEFLKEDYRANIYAGLSALNMEFLFERPLNQSGVSKELDRQELNSFIYQVASHVVENVLGHIHRIVTAFYYSGRAYNAEWSVPRIKTPQGFDFVSTDTYEDKIKKLRDSGVSTGIINAVERRYIEKEFNNFEIDKEYLLLINNLDPLSAYTTDEKKLLYETSAVSYEDYVASSNIEKLIRNILDDINNFAKKPYNEQVKTLYKYTKKLIKGIESYGAKKVTKGSQPQEFEGGVLDEGDGGSAVEVETNPSV